MDADTVKAVTDLLRFLYDVLGVNGMVGVPVALVVALGVAWWYRSRQGDALVDEKERTIQRLADENRELRIVIFKEVHSWSDDQIEKWILRNERPDGAATRRVLEGEKDKRAAPKLSTKGNPGRGGRK